MYPVHKRTTHFLDPLWDYVVFASFAACLVLLFRALAGCGVNLEVSTSKADVGETHGTQWTDRGVPYTLPDATHPLHSPTATDALRIAPTVNSVPPEQMPTPILTSPSPDLRRYYEQNAIDLDALFVEED